MPPGWPGSSVSCHLVSSLRLPLPSSLSDGWFLIPSLTLDLAILESAYIKIFRICDAYYHPPLLRFVSFIFKVVMSQQRIHHMEQWFLLYRRTEPVSAAPFGKGQLPMPNGQSLHGGNNDCLSDFTSIVFPYYLFLCVSEEILDFLHIFLNYFLIPFPSQTFPSSTSCGWLDCCG